MSAGDDARYLGVAVDAIGVRGWRDEPLGAKADPRWELARGGCPLPKRPHWVSLVLLRNATWLNSALSPVILEYLVSKTGPEGRSAGCEWP